MSSDQFDRALEQYESKFGIEFSSAQKKVLKKCVVKKCVEEKDKKLFAKWGVFSSEDEMRKTFVPWMEGFIAKPQRSEDKPPKVQPPPETKVGVVIQKNQSSEASAPKSPVKSSAGKEAVQSESSPVEGTEPKKAPNMPTERKKAADTERKEPERKKIVVLRRSDIVPEGTRPGRVIRDAPRTEPPTPKADKPAARIVHVSPKAGKSDAKEQVQVQNKSDAKEQKDKEPSGTDPKQKRVNERKVIKPTPRSAKQAEKKQPVDKGEPEQKADSKQRRENKRVVKTKQHAKKEVNSEEESEEEDPKKRIPNQRGGKEQLAKKQAAKEGATDKQQKKAAGSRPVKTERKSSEGKKGTGEQSAKKQPAKTKSNKKEPKKEPKKEAESVPAFNMSAPAFQPLNIVMTIISHDTEDDNGYYLGVDIGTSKVAVVLYDPVKHCPVYSSNARIPRMLSPKSPEVMQYGYCGEDSGVPEGAPALWSASAILDACVKALNGLPKKPLSSICGICATGQMHGVVVLCDGKPVTPFANWQDQSCSRGFLEALRAKTGYPSLSQGHGCVTLSRWAASAVPPFDGDVMEGIVACTIMDYFCATLCGGDEEVIPAIDPTNASAWGLYSVSGSCWNEEALKNAGLSSSFMPKVVKSGTVIGHSGGAFANKCGLPSGIPVCVAAGDFQAALYATTTSAADSKKVPPEECLSLNIGTSAQLAVLVPSNSPIAKAAERDERKSYEVRPYLDDRFNAVTAAAMMGGSAWLAFVESVCGWCSQICGEDFDRNEVQNRLIELGLEALGRQDDKPKSEEALLCVDTRFAGERQDPDVRGSVTGITATNARDIGTISAAVVRGIVRNLRDMLPSELFTSGRSWTLVGSGNAVRGSLLLREVALRIFGSECSISQWTEEAATGIAMFIASKLRH